MRRDVVEGDFTDSVGFGDTAAQSVSVRKVLVNDVEQLVAVHRSAFEGFFLTRLGPDFLKAYYTTILEYKGGIALLAESTDGTCEGFVTGFIDPQRFKQELRKKTRKLMLSTMLSIVKQPELLPNLVRNALRMFKRDEYIQESVELSSIAVARGGRGIGSLLVQAFEVEAQLIGGLKIKLTTDSQNNEDVRRFYEKQGFCLSKFTTRGSRTLCVYEKSLARQ